MTTIHVIDREAIEQDQERRAQLDEAIKAGDWHAILRHSETPNELLKTLRPLPPITTEQAQAIIDRAKAARRNLRIASTLAATGAAVAIAFLVAVIR
jgi:hypothetical protein